MANKTNYYQWLDLPVETFENDPEKLSKILEQKIKEWNSHKRIEIQNRANIHQDCIRQAIRDPKEWERIYKEYIASVDANIESNLIFFVVDGIVPEDSVSDLAVANKVSIDYVRRICAKKGYGIGEGNGQTTGKEEVSFTIDDLKPVCYNSIKPIQALIEGFGVPTLMDLLSDPNFGGNIITESSSDDKVWDALNKMKDKWINKPSTGPKATQKTHVNMICTLPEVLKKEGFKAYIQYLKYVKANSILTRITGAHVTELTEQAFNTTVTQLYEITVSHDKARSILIAFCQEKNIAYPVVRKNIAVCPYCSNGFERTEPLQKDCPVCGKSLIVKCPKCGCEKNIIVDTECDGINIGAYPLLAKKLRTVHDCCDSLMLDIACYRLKEITSVWPGYEGTAEAQSRIDSLDKQYSADLKRIAVHCEKKEFYSAKTIIDRIDGAFPRFKDNYPTVYFEISTAETAFKEAMNQSDVNQRVSSLLDINENISDYTKLNEELKKYPVQPITGLSINADSDLGLVTLSWKSENQTNSVVYSVRRKRNSMVANINDGEEITRTQSLSCSDNTVEEGQVYYYAVYAFRGPLISPLMAAKEPTIMIKRLEISVTPLDSSLDLTWESSICKITLSYSDKPIRNCNEGTEVKNLSSNGVVIEGLNNNTPYYIAAYKSMNFGGKVYLSELSVLPAIMPIKHVEPPVISKMIGGKAGEYILSDGNDSSDNPLVFYYTNQLVGITEKTRISIADMEKKAKSLKVEEVSDGYRVDMAGNNDMYVYPAYKVSGTLIVGNIIRLLYVKPVNATATISGSTMCINIDQWPENTDQILICYSYDSFIQDPLECERANKAVKTKSDYIKRPVLEIPNIQAKEYFITLFSRKEQNVVPIGTIKFSLKQKVNIYYSFEQNLIGGYTKIIIRNSGSYRPPVEFAVGNGGIPLRKEAAIFRFTIPENPAAPPNEVIKIPNFRAGKTSYAKLFCDFEEYCFLCDGLSKLKK